MATWNIAENDGFPMPDDGHPAARPRLNRIRGMLALFQGQVDALAKALRAEMETEAVFVDDSVVGGAHPFSLCYGPYFNEIDRIIRAMDVMASRTQNRVGMAAYAAKEAAIEASAELEPDRPGLISLDD